MAFGQAIDGRSRRARSATWWVALLTTLAMVAGGFSLAAPVARAAESCSGGSLHIVAHEDDDLLFTSPDLLADVTGQRCTRTLFLTAGDAGNEDTYWQSRERGIEAAYASMAGVTNAWSTATVSLGGKSVRMRTLSAAPSVSVLFLRLPDGFPLGTGSSRRGYQSIKRLLDGAISTISALDGTASYTSSTLRNTVLDTMRLNQSAMIRTHNYVTSYGSDSDHYDHHSTGYVARDASVNYTAGHILRSYRGYDISESSSNVSGTNLDRKRSAFQTYAAFDSEVDVATYEGYGWLSRQYVNGTTGTVAANAGADQVVAAGTLARLDASGSVGVGAVTYAWTQTAGATVALTGATTVSPTFTPTAAGTYTFQVAVTSGASTATDAVSVTVTRTDTTNVARLSGVTATASSQASSQTAAKAIDGSVLGYPSDYTKEWATAGGKAGSWLNLAWSAPVLLDRVVLYDRPNSDDRVLGGTLTFSDGSTVSVGNLANSGATTVGFPARVTSSIRFTVTSVATTSHNIGLAEFEAYGSVDVAPVASAGPDQTVQFGSGAVTLDATASTDPDAGTTLTYAWARTSGPAVTLTGATTAKPTFTPTALGTYVFAVTVSDGALTNTDTVTITVVPANRPPVANAGPDQAGVAGTAVQLNGAASSDPDANTTLGYTWTQTGGPTATLAGPLTATPRFTPGLEGTYVFTLVVTDGTATSTDQVTVLVAADRPPVANAGADRTVLAGVPVTLDGSGTDPDVGAALTFAWTQPDGTPVVLSNPAVAKPTFTPTVPGVYTFDLAVSDGLLTHVDSVTLTVAANQPPVADAGADQTVIVGNAVTLEGSGTDPNPGTTLTYAWAQTGGAAVTLSSAVVARPTFTPTATGTYTFALTVRDEATPHTDTVTITVIPQPNRPPTADAGPDAAAYTGARVTLGGLASDPDGSALTYAWTRSGGTGPDVVLEGAATLTPSFVSAAAGTYVFTLTVTDGEFTATDTVTVVVSDAPPNLPPTAVAGADRSASTGDTVTLDGTGSTDPDGTALTHSWTRSGGTGPDVTLTGPAAKRAFVPTVPGTYTFTLTVSDGQLTDSDQVTITVTQANRAPVASAGPDQSVLVGATVTLDASGSTDPDAGTTLTYAWARSGGTGPAVTLATPNAAQASFTPTAGGTYTFTVTVGDGTLTHTDAVTVTVVQPNRAPTANAGADKAAVTGAVVTLAGTGTDPDAGTTLTYAWTRNGGTGPAVTLVNATSSTATFTPASVGTYTFTLTVSDGVLSHSDDVTVTVTQANRAPTANAGADKSVVAGTLVTLAGSATDPDAGTTLTYAWTQTAGTSVTLTNPNTATATFTPTAAGTYTFSLTASDGVLWHADSVTVTVTAPVNVALTGRTVTQSSQNTSTSQQGTKAVDGVISGYPGDYTKEWATVGGKAGSWIQLTWASAVRIDRIVLYDRPNTDDQILAGALVFSDGTSVPVTTLNNAGTATTFTFTARTVTSVRLNITSVSTRTSNVGLSEFQVWGSTAV